MAGVIADLNLEPEIKVWYPVLSPDGLRAWQIYNSNYYMYGSITSTDTTTVVSNVPAYNTTGTTLAYQAYASTSTAEGLWFNPDLSHFEWMTNAAGTGPLDVKELAFSNGLPMLRTEPETPEQRVRREAAQQRAIQRVNAISRRRKRQRAAADQLAENLLLACMSPEQARDHLEHGWFDVLSSRGRRFRIYTRTSAWSSQPGASQSGNVVLLGDGDRHEARYCVHPPDGLPHGDAWLAQKLALEADEDTVLAVANMPWSHRDHLDIRAPARERLRLIRTAA